MSSSPPIYVAVIEADEHLCRSLARLLRASGMHPVTYSSVEAFRADIKQPQFDCLLLDIQLGGASGIELGYELAAGGAHLPFIFLSDCDEPDKRRMAKDAGCAAYLLKTDSGGAVLKAVRMALGKAKLTS
jgi:DNA-binding response OmpR family regulator